MSENYCKGCPEIECCVREVSLEEKCVCRNCLVKTMCATPCKEYEKFKNYVIAKIVN